MSKKTIVSVAKELKLAPSTVSKVLNKNGNVSQATRDRVMKYVNEVGYIQNSSARILKSSRSHTLGILFSDISLVGLEHSFFSSILQNFKNYVEKEGYEIIFVVNRVGDRQMTYLNWCQQKNVDGVLLVSGNLNNPMIIELVNSSIPCVSTDFIMPKLITVISDNDQGIDLALEHARELQHERIGFISGQITSKAFSLRLHRFEQRIKELGISASIVSAEGFGYHSGYEAAVKMAEQSIEIPTYVIVASDDLAFGAIHGFQSKGYRVPEDISVIGFDDIKFSNIFSPALTTIAQDKKRIGETAAQRLLEAINFPTPKEQEVVTIPVTLIKRVSTKNKNT